MEKYSSGLVSESFWFIEVKKIIKLRHDGKTWDDIKLLCLEDNLLGISKEYRASCDLFLLPQLLLRKKHRNQNANFTYRGLTVNVVSMVRNSK